MRDSTFLKLKKLATSFLLERDNHFVKRSQSLPSQYKDWPSYWRIHNQSWRREPEINLQRQAYLAQRRVIAVDIKQSIYPFGGIQLDRADIEWLLSTHDDGQGAVDWYDVTQQNRKGLDLRGALLCQVDLSGLPLARTYGSLAWADWLSATEEQREAAAVHLEGCNLNETRLEGARLRKAHLEDTMLKRAHLEDAHLFQACLEGANLSRAHLEGANLREVVFVKNNVGSQKSTKSHLLRKLKTSEKFTDLHHCYFDHASSLDGIVWSSSQLGSALVVDVHWNGANLSVIDWSTTKLIGDEVRAKSKKDEKSMVKSREKRLHEYTVAVRANRQLSLELQNQGLSEESAHFAYRAQVLQRTVFWYRKNLWQYTFSLLLDILAGYGYKPGRSFLSYLIVVFSFMIAYLLNSHFLVSHLTWDEALVLSISSFHGRGFFAQDITLGDSYARLSAIEAILGLFVEVSFVATFTRRFFGP